MTSCWTETAWYSRVVYYVFASTYYETVERKIEATLTATATPLLRCTIATVGYLSLLLALAPDSIRVSTRMVQLKTVLPNVATKRQKIGAMILKRPAALLPFMLGCLVLLTLKTGFLPTTDPAGLAPKTSNLPSPVKRQNGKPKPFVQVEATDYIYSTKEWKFAAPIVLESHKLIFFVVQKTGGLYWKQLFRRMMGIADWTNTMSIVTDNPQKNGLTYLHQYSLTKATELMNDPSYTRAIFVRDPKDRFLAAYLNKVMGENNGRYFHIRCCMNRPGGRQCLNKLQSGNYTFQEFTNKTRTCQDSHWTAQSIRVDEKILPTLDFVGHVETAAHDAKLLLKHIGAWEQYGKSGWGPSGTESIFEEIATNEETTSKAERWVKYYTPEIEKEVEERFAKDYAIPELGFKMNKITPH